MFKVNNTDTRMTDVIDVVLVPLLLTLNVFHSYSKVYIDAFEHVFCCWKGIFFQILCKKFLYQIIPRTLNDKFGHYQGPGSFALLTRSIISCFIIFSPQVYR